jgi:hypothetical protein
VSWETLKGLTDGTVSTRSARLRHEVDGILSALKRTTEWNPAYVGEVVVNLVLDAAQGRRVPKEHYWFRDSEQPTLKDILNLIREGDNPHAEEEKG